MKNKGIKACSHILKNKSIEQTTKKKKVQRKTTKTTQKQIAGVC